MFGIVVAVQNALRLEMHQNDVFFIFLKSAHQNNLKT